MRIGFIILFSLLFCGVNAQTYQEIKANRVIVNNVLRPVMDTITLNARDSGAIAYKNGASYVWNGYKWNAPAGSSASNTIYVTQRGDSGDSVVTALNDSTLWSSRLRDSTGIAIDRASDGALVIRATGSSGSADKSISVLNGLGVPVITQTFPLELSSSAVVKSGSDNQINFVAIYIPEATTITGVYYYLQTQGVFTGDNFNGFALFSYSGGTLTQVAITSNSASHFNGTVGGKSAAFTTPYSASPGTYYVAWLYCQSAQTTAPALASKTATTIFASLFTNSANLNMFWNGQTAMPASVATTSLTGGTGGSTWIGLY